MTGAREGIRLAIRVLVLLVVSVGFLALVQQANRALMAPSWLAFGCGAVLYLVAVAGLASAFLAVAIGVWDVAKAVNAVDAASKNKEEVE